MAGDSSYNIKFKKYAYGDGRLVATASELRLKALDVKDEGRIRDLLVES